MTRRPVLQHAELEGGPFYWKGGSTGVLLLHGFTATTAEVRPLAHILHQQGYTVAAPLLPGHGTTPQDLNRQKWSDWASAADDAYQYLSASTERLFVGGSSMGGLLTLLLASRHPQICGILLYAPAMRIHGLQYARWVSIFKSTAKKKSTDENMAWKGYYVNPLRAAAQLFRLQGEVRRRLRHVRQPVLILQGKLDRTIDPYGAQVVFEDVSSQVKKLYWLENSSHVILLDREFDLAAEITLNFIKDSLED